MTNKNSKETLCWDCLNSVPNKERGCSWSERLEAVDGWQVKYSKSADSYIVKSCPNFILDPKSLLKPKILKYD